MELNRATVTSRLNYCHNNESITVEQQGRGLGISIAIHGDLHERLALKRPLPSVKDLKSMHELIKCPGATECSMKKTIPPLQGGFHYNHPYHQPQSYTVVNLKWYRRYYTPLYQRYTRTSGIGGGSRWCTGETYHLNPCCH